MLNMTPLQNREKEEEEKMIKGEVKQFNRRISPGIKMVEKKAFKAHHRNISSGITKQIIWFR